ncbi:MAG: class I SAM-dependent methyltransferase [Candidatus Promineifilaceae bacterium]|jgi:ubiquinone/menaquinone biosynthesis C-methylase UbiE
MTESRIYFAQVANDWDRLRSGYFTEAMRDAAIQKAGLRQHAVVADVGTGTGFVLQGLLGKAKSLVGFDESPDMLDVARRRFASTPEVHFQLTDGRTLPAPDNSFDAVFANMYLHHTPDPAAAVREMTRILEPGGKLIITDLDSHDQEWMREAMADRWLGFEREVVCSWFEAAGLLHVDIDCADGTCDCSALEGNPIALSIFIAAGQKP